MCVCNILLFMYVAKCMYVPSAAREEGAAAVLSGPSNKSMRSPLSSFGRKIGNFGVGPYVCMYVCLYVSMFTVMICIYEYKHPLFHYVCMYVI